MNVCLIIVTWNRVQTLLQTLQCVSVQTVPPHQIVVVDNGSDDGTIATLNDFRTFDFHLISLPGNLGYAYGLTKGMEYAMATFDDLRYFLLMDDDSHPNPDFIERMMIAKSKVKAPGMLCTMGFVDTIWKGPVAISNVRNKEERLVSTSPNVYSVDHTLVDGALVDLEVAKKVGTPRGDFFMMCEDLEYSKRIRKAGYALFVLEETEGLQRHHHGGGQSFSPGTLWRGYYHSRNHLIILRQYFSVPSLLTYVIRQSKYLVASLSSKDRGHRIGLRLLGILHGLLGKTGKTIDPLDIYRRYDKSIR